MQKEYREVAIERIDSRGRGRASVRVGDGTARPLVVAGALPGDVIDVRVRRRKARTYHGEITAFHRHATARRRPFCRHFEECGGCTIQDLEYSAQCDLKREMVRSAFTEAGFAFEANQDGTGPAAGEEIDASEADRERFEPLPELPEVIGAENERRYRNKLEFSFGAQRWLSENEVVEAARIDDRRGLGFHVAGRFDRVLDLTECHLQDEPSESIRTFIRDYSRENGLTYYDSREHHGFLRLLTIRTSLSGETMVIVTFGEDRPEDIRSVMEAIRTRFATLHSLNYVVNTSKNDSIYPHEVVTWSGEPWITELCGPNTLRVRPKAFYQTNPRQAMRLYEAAFAHLQPTRDELVFDLYSGIGSIALAAARSVDRVVGIESVPDAVRAARENARLNGIDNVVFEEGAVEDTLSEVAARHGRPDVVIVDPPRSGLHPRALDRVRDLSPPRILYISCNPRTQASDVAALREWYRVEALQPVDMFPQTRHVENIVALRRR